MSDRDSDHMLLELQEARAEIDRLRELLRWRSRWDEPPPMAHGIYLVIGFNFDMKRRIWVAKFDGKWPDNLAVDHWRPIGPLPHSDMPVFSKESVAMYECKCGAIKNTNEPCLNCGPLPGGE